MSRFHGTQGKGAMKRHRELKRLEAKERNAKACARRWKCGHVHGHVTCDVPENDDPGVQHDLA